MKTPTPFCCDITSGSEQERNEFKRLFKEASENEWSFNNSCYGFNYLNEWDSWNRLENIKMYFNGNILPLSEGIAILKEMVGEEEKETTYTEQEIDFAYLAGVFNVSGIDGLYNEIQRLKSLGKNPHDIIIEGRNQQPKP